MNEPKLIQSNLDEHGQGHEIFRGTGHCHMCLMNGPEGRVEKPVIIKVHRSPFSISDGAAFFYCDNHWNDQNVEQLLLV